MLRACSTRSAPIVISSLASWAASRAHPRNFSRRSIALSRSILHESRRNFAARQRFDRYARGGRRDLVCRLLLEKKKKIILVMLNTKRKRSSDLVGLVGGRRVAYTQ